MTAEVGFVHRRHRMPRHHGVPVEPMNRAMRGREQISDSLIAAHAGIGDDKWNPAAKTLRRNIDRTPYRTDLRRGIEGRADLVMDHGRARRRQQFEYRRQVLVHPVRAFRPRDPRDANHLVVRKIAQALGRRRRQKQDRLDACESRRLHRCRRSREIVAVERDQRPGGQGANCAHAAISSARRRLGRVRANSASGTPVSAACQASCSAATPAPVPRGCAMIPPPAVTIRSAEPNP